MCFLIRNRPSISNTLKHKDIEDLIQTILKMVKLLSQASARYLFGLGTRDMRPKLVLFHHFGVRMGILGLKFSKTGKTGTLIVRILNFYCFSNSLLINKRFIGNFPAVSLVA